MRRIAAFVSLVVILVSCNKSDLAESYLTELVTDSLKVLQSDIPIDEYSDLVFVNSNTGYAISRSGSIVKTSDAALHWTILPSFAGSYLHRVQFTSLTTGYIAGQDNTSGFLLKTIDAGQSWEKIRLNMTESPSGICFLNDNTGYIAGKNMFGKTTDGGKTWTDIVPPVDNFSDVKFRNTAEGYATSDNGKYYRTTNGGNSWQPLQAESGNHLQGIYFSSSKSFAKSISNALIDLNTGKQAAQVPQEATRLLFLNDRQVTGVGQHYEAGFWPYGDIFLSNNNWTNYARQKYMPSEAVSFTALARLNDHRTIFIGTGHLKTMVVQLSH